MKHHEYTKLWPMLEGTELVKLTEDIAAHGLRMSILTYKGEILDGRNRERACKAAGVEPHYEEAPANTDDEALDLVVSLNEHRRHLTLAQRAFAAERLATLRGAGRPTTSLIRSDERIMSNIKSLNAAAARMKVSVGSAARARIIRNHGTEADVEEVLTGKTTLNARAESLRNKARTTKKNRGEKPPPKSEPRLVFPSIAPLRELSQEEVAPGFTGTRIDFVDQGGHHQNQTFAERAKMVLTAWLGQTRSLMLAAKRLPDWPSDAAHWIEYLDAASEYEVAKLAEAVEYLGPKIDFARALLARAQSVALAKKRA